MNTRRWLSISLAAAVAMACWPAASSALAAWRAEIQMSEAASAVGAAGDQARQEALAQAARYNERLAGRDAEGAVPYAEQLSATGRPEICWVKCERLGICQPVYRGTDDAALAAGAGHLEGSALPVGGAGTRCVICGHSGVPGRRVFDGLADAREGDVFVLWTLGEPHAYRVVSIRELSPEDAAAALAPVGESDLATLVTCTSSDAFTGPAAALNAFVTRRNDLRLLVTGVRCEYDPQQAEGVPEKRSGGDAAPALCAAAVAAGAAAWAARRARRRKAPRSWRPGQAKGKTRGRRGKGGPR